jgi:K+ transporter
MDGALARNAKKSAPPVERPAAAAALTGLGIVYGDLGTSPLYIYQTIVGTVEVTLPRTMPSADCRLSSGHSRFH